MMMSLKLKHPPLRAVQGAASVRLLPEVEVAVDSCLVCFSAEAVECCSPPWTAEVVAGELEYLS